MEPEITENKRWKIEREEREIKEKGKRLTSPVLKMPLVCSNHAHPISDV